MCKGPMIKPMGIARHRPSKGKGITLFEVVVYWSRQLQKPHENPCFFEAILPFSIQTSKYASLGIRGCFGPYRYISKICAWLVKKFLSEVDGWEILQIRRIGKHFHWFMNFYLSQLLSRMSSYRGWWNRIKLTRSVRQSQRGFGSRRIFATSGWGNIES